MNTQKNNDVDGIENIHHQANKGLKMNDVLFLFLLYNISKRNKTIKTNHDEKKKQERYNNNFNSVK